MKTNIEALIGKEAVTISTIRPMEVGRIKLNGQEWSAVCRTEDAAIEEGAKVKVMAIEGVKAIVVPLEK